ncbi:lipoxygenase [Massariosphaeria phaeospora]|uniref:Manganese lipoxygenase n=1 Tax=Massariosphaeria phaeospora TaxID=100035 RepID=A0A7C8MTX9_9PLEO|nr:lipoxygenase [Massariosphaeria phaeospora]
MRSNFLSVLLSGLVLAEAAPQFLVPRSSGSLLPRQAVPASISNKESYSESRALAVSTRKEGFQYGPSLVGEAAFFPNGTLGDARAKADWDLWNIDRLQIEAGIKADIGAVKAAIGARNGTFRTLQDFHDVLYTHQWNKSVPASQAPGILTNYTQDLLFSMERLTQNPYPLELVKPTDPVPFDVDAGIVKKLTTTTLEALKASGSLFVVDHQYQAKYTRVHDKFGAYCTALFYIHPVSEAFLPLAIITNVGSNLVYTPEDTKTDWLLAKMMFNVNDFFQAQMFHLVATHDVGEAVHEAAMRTLSEEHPVMILLERFMFQAYSARPVGEKLCFNPGGHWDENFLISEKGCRDYVTEFWPTAGRYQANYLLTDLKTRGLISDTDIMAPKTPFKSFPFLTDTLEIRNNFHTFFAEFVSSYYDCEEAIAADIELQNWFGEATVGAKVHDFPQCGTGSNKPCTRAVLVDVLTHFAFINGVAHHSLNSGDPVRAKGTLPFHLNGMYADVPKAKGVTDLMPFLPSATQSLAYTSFMVTFNRPFYEAQNRTLAHAFNDQDMLARLNDRTKKAAEGFYTRMMGVSKRIRAKSFDKDGLSEGMPFVWQAVDPAKVPFFFAV